MSSATSLPFGVNDTAVRTTLSSGITSTDTSVDVGEVTNPPALPFLIAVFVDQSPLREDDMEIMEVTSISGTTLTVNRGAKGTSAQSFSSGDKVFMGIVPSDVFDRDPAGILSGEGQVISADSNGDPTNVSAGADGDVLQMSGSQPTFGPSPAGGAWSKVQFVEVNSNQSDVSFTSGISSNPDSYCIVISNLVPDDAVVNPFALQFSDDGGSTYIENNYEHERFRISSGSTSQVGDASANFVTFAEINDTLPNIVNGLIFLQGISNSNTYPSCWFTGQVVKNDQSLRVIGSGMTEKAKTSIDAVRLFVDGSNIANGNFGLYAIEK